MRRWFSNQTGQAVAEAALIIPVLLFLLMGIFVAGYWINVKQVATAAAREGARVGAQSGSKIAVQEAVYVAMQAIDTDRAHTKITFDTDPNDKAGSTLLVIVKYDLQFVIPYFKSEYEKNAISPYPFASVAEQASSRLEQDFVNP